MKMNLAPHWVEKESPNVLRVHVRRRNTPGSTVLGRIDTEERIYHIRHHDLANFVRWSDSTVPLGLEELTLCREYGVLWIDFFDQSHETLSTISFAQLEQTGKLIEREIIGWRWVTPFDEWAKREAVV